MPERVIIVGAGPAGLAVAACLKQRGVAALLLEVSQQVGSAWRHHYDRLHLHTHKGGSHLPGLAFPSDYPRYLSREQFIAYLEGYARHFGLEPALGEGVGRIERDGDQWTVTTSKRQITSQHVVIATGSTRVPVRPTWPGLDIFKGEVLHSSRYKNGAAWKGKRVLVVGIGNSGGEIAIDLHEHGAKPTIAVRSDQGLFIAALDREKRLCRSRVEQRRRTSNRTVRAYTAADRNNSHPPAIVAAEVLGVRPHQWHRRTRRPTEGSSFVLSLPLDRGSHRAHDPPSNDDGRDHESLQGPLKESSTCRNRRAEPSCSPFVPPTDRATARVKAGARGTRPVS